MNVNENGKQLKTETNPRGAGRRSAGTEDLELQRMREGIRGYVREELALGHTPCEILLKYMDTNLDEPSFVG